MRRLLVAVLLVIIATPALARQQRQHPFELLQFFNFPLISQQYSSPQILIDTNLRVLTWYRPDGYVRTYHIGVGRDGFREQTKGQYHIERKAEWPDWYPPEEMRKRQPELPEMMAGGPGNPLGARALYISGTLLRIHGTSDPKSIGRAESSGCFRMLNRDVIELYNQVPVGTKVTVL